MSDDPRCILCSPASVCLHARGTEGGVVCVLGHLVTDVRDGFLWCDLLVGLCGEAAPAAWDSLEELKTSSHTTLKGRKLFTTDRAAEVASIFYYFDN